MISNEIAREDRAPFRKGASLIKRTPTYIKPVRRRMEKKLGSDRKLMFVPLVCWESPVLHGQHLSHGFLLFSPSSAAAPTTTTTPHSSTTLAAPRVTASGAPRHHVNPCITASASRAKNPVGLYRRREEGILKNWGAEDLQAPRRAGPECLQQK